MAAIASSSVPPSTTTRREEKPKRWVIKESLIRGPNIDPESLRLKSIVDYRFTEVKRRFILEYETKELEKTAEEAESVIGNINQIIANLKTSPIPCYFFNDSNPFVALLQPNGQLFWRAVYTCCIADIEALIFRFTDLNEITPFANQTVLINVGGHGGRNGFTVYDDPSYGDGNFFLNTLALSYARNERAAVNQMSSTNPADYREAANHVIDLWCHSIKSVFVAPIQHYHFQDLLTGELRHPDYRCIYSRGFMSDPYYFESCRKLEGRVHYYDKSSIDKLKALYGEVYCCHLTACAQELRLDDAKPSPLLRREIAAFQYHKAQEKKLATLRESHVGALIGPLTLAGSPVPPRFFNGVLQNVLAIEAIRGDRTVATYRAEVTFALVQIQEITQGLSGVDPSIIRAAMRADFRDVETAILEDMQRRLINIRESAQKIAVEAHKQIEDRQRGESIDAAVIKTQERGKWVAVLPSLTTIHDELRSLIHDRKLSEKEVTIGQQKEKLQAREEETRKAQEEAKNLKTQKEEQAKELQTRGEENRKLAGLARQQAERIRALEEEIDMAALRRRIDAMDFDERDHRSPNFIEAATYRLSVFNKVLSSLNNFKGLFEDGNIFLMTGRKTTFVIPDEEKTLNISEIRAITGEFEYRPKVMDRVLTASYEAVVDNMRLWRRSSEGGYCDVFHRGVSDDRMRPKLVIWSELQSMAQEMHIHLHALLDSLNLNLAAPRTESLRHRPACLAPPGAPQTDREIDWNKAEEGRVSPKTFEDKLVEMVSRAIAIKWVKQNNGRLTTYLAAIGRSI